MALSPLKPLHPEIRNPASFQELAVQAVKILVKQQEYSLPPGIQWECSWKRPNTKPFAKSIKKNMQKISGM